MCDQSCQLVGFVVNEACPLSSTGTSTKSGELLEPSCEKRTEPPKLGVIAAVTVVDHDPPDMSTGFGVAVAEIAGRSAMLTVTVLPVAGVYEVVPA